MISPIVYANELKRSPLIIKKTIPIISLYKMECADAKSRFDLFQKILSILVNNIPKKTINIITPKTPKLIYPSARYGIEILSKLNPNSLAMYAPEPVPFSLHKLLGTKNKRAVIN